MLRRFHLPKALGRAQSTRSFAIARSLHQKTIPTTLPVSSRTFSSSIAIKLVSGRRKEGEEKQTWASDSEEEPHDPNCVCQDPNARLTEDTLLALVDFTKKFAPSTLSAPELDDVITDSLQYLRSVDIPARELSCCAHTFGQFHAEMALACLAKIVASDQFEYNPYFADRIAEAWPEIRAWLHYTFTDWISSGKFIGRQKEDRIHGYRGIIPFIEALCRVPDLRQLLLQTPSERQNLVLVLSFCWQMESEDWFELPQAYAPFTSAAAPLAALAEVLFKSGEQDNVEEFFSVFNLVAAGAKLNPSRVAEMALNPLKNTASLPLPALASHIGLLTILAREPAYSQALFAQHSFQRIIQIFADLTSNAHNPTTAKEVVACIRPCLTYLVQSIMNSDGYTFVAEALSRDILAVLFRSTEWITPDHDSCLYLQIAFHQISVYTIYPSIFLPLVASVDKFYKSVEDAEKDLDDHPGDDLIGHEVNALTDIITERFLRLDPFTYLKCQNCGEANSGISGTTCSKCFRSSYCSEACQTAHWTASHGEECKTWQNARNDPDSPQLPILPHDIDYACDIAMTELQLNREEIVQVWRAEMPQRTPLVSIDYTQKLGGILSIGDECLTNIPQFFGKPVLDPLDFRAMWDAERLKGFHDEHVLVGIFLPHGPEVQPHWRWIPINPEYTEGTVVERLIQTVQFLEREDIDAITNE